MDELTQYKERLQIALSAAKICVFEVDLVRQLYTFFENAEAIFGVSGETILKEVRPFSALDPAAYQAAISAYFSHPDDAPVIGAAFQKVLSGRPAHYEARMRAGGSGFLWCGLNVTPILEDGRPVRMVGVITDITDFKERTDSLRQAVNLDDFTGLYKKGYAIALIDEALRRDHHLRHALIMLDVDNFKHFNDTYGHAEGDKVLQAVSRQIKQAFRKTDVVGRFGGDEFIIFAQDIGEDRWLRGKLDRLTRFQVDGVACTGSIGAALFPQDAAGFDALFQKADEALYRAKARRGTFVFFSDGTPA